MKLPRAPQLKVRTLGCQQGKHGFFNQFIVVFHDRCSARIL
ncbi:hypothetical protein C4K00_2951 [Pseudomonas synxantha]|nr:hypothetical protein C4K00_2951 [Pseudomonas synxantha]AZE78775.1 hypothetical protein C4J99_2991 [Pseudomonas synxantha]